MPPACARCSNRTTATSSGCRTSTGKRVIRSRTFRELLDSWRPNPGYGEPYEILSLAVHDGALAFATVRIDWPPRGSYIDHLTLHKAGDRWRITTKTFVWRPAESPPEPGSGERP